MKNAALTNRKTSLSSGVVFLQRVDDAKIEQARHLRKTMTPAEMLLWERLRDRRCGGLRFRRQQVIEGYIVDFFCHEKKLVVELDGPVHDQSANALNDERRTDVFLRRGLNEIRFRNEEVLENADKVVESIIDFTSKL